MLTPGDIARIAAEFDEQRSAFEFVTSTIHREVNDLMEDRAIKSLVTSRTKRRASLEKKLAR